MRARLRIAMRVSVCVVPLLGRIASPPARGAPEKVAATATKDPADTAAPSIRAALALVPLTSESALKSKGF